VVDLRLQAKPALVGVRHEVSVCVILGTGGRVDLSPICDLFDGPRFGKPLPNDLAKAIGSMLEERTSVKSRCFVATSRLEMKRAC
jgi:hypothetical protein